MDKRKWLYTLLALLLIAALCAGGVLLYRSLTQGEVGEKGVTVVVERGGAQQKVLEVRTDTQKLIELLEELEERGKLTFAADEGAYGKYITAVEGYTANADNQEWWAIQVNGEMAAMGVSDIPVRDGDTYTLVLMVGW